MERVRIGGERSGRKAQFYSLCKNILCRKRRDAVFVESGRRERHEPMAS